MAHVIAFQEDKEQKREHLIDSTWTVEYEYEYIACEYEYRVYYIFLCSNVCQNWSYMLISAVKDFFR